MADADTHDYRCTVTLILEDVTEETAVTGYLAVIDDAGRVDRVGP